MTEGTISRWLKAVGEAVSLGEPIVEVETEKVIVEVETPHQGVLVRIVAQEQETVPVDGVLCLIGEADEVETPPAAAAAPVPEPEPAPAGVPGQPPGGETREVQEVRNVRDLSVAMPASVSNVIPIHQQQPPSPAESPPRGTAAASPLARRVAESLGIELSGLKGSGAGGKIVMADLQPFIEAAQGGAQGAFPATEGPGGFGAVPGGVSGAGPSANHRASASPRAADFLRDEDIPHSPLRRAIARRMGESKREAPHFYMTAEIDVTEAMLLRERLNGALSEAQSDDVRISVNDLMIKATALALEKAPDLNAAYGETALRRFGAVHIGFAASTGEGLVTPVVRDCHLKSIGRIARETGLLIEKARNRRLKPEDLQGGTFTISNLGMYPVVEFSAIINPPQAGILAIAQPQLRPVPDRGRVVFRQLMKATLSADHRAVDGVTGAVFLQAFKEVLESPERLML